MKMYKIVSPHLIPVLMLFLTRVDDHVNVLHPHAEIATFIVAGHETSSAGIAWCLHCLSNNIEVQERLRDEVCDLGTESPDEEQIKSLKYLDYVVREGLRLYPPIPSTTRVAMKDDIIPLSNGTGIRYAHNVALAYLIGH